MYSLGFDVLPVDTHVARIATRLGLIKCKSSREMHQTLNHFIPPALRFGFHVRCVQHGRKVCRGSRPRCDECCLAPICASDGVR